MYKLFIFLITFILLIFEISVYLFFAKPLDSNVLTLMCIMILPGFFTLIHNDVRAYKQGTQGLISKKIEKRKFLFYMTQKIPIYSLIFSGIGSCYLGLFSLLQYREFLGITTVYIMIFLIIGAITQLIGSSLTLK